MDVFGLIEKNTGISPLCGETKDIAYQQYNPYVARRKEEIKKPSSSTIVFYGDSYKLGKPQTRVLAFKSMPSKYVERFAVKPETNPNILNWMAQKQRRYLNLGMSEEMI